MTSKNHPGEGTDFEVLLPALVSIKLCFNEDVKDFNLDTNVKGFENLDDLLVEVIPKQGEIKKFAFQLKHKANESDPLTCQNFEQTKGDFSLSKYYKGYTKIKKKDGYNFILYTNKNFAPETTQTARFRISNNTNCPDLPYFYAQKNDYTDVNQAVYKFEVCDNEVDEEFKNFLSKLSVYTNQLNASEIYNELKNIFNDKFSSDRQVDSYVTFFRDWHKGRFTDTKLNMDMVKFKLFDLFLTPHVVQISSKDGEDQKSDLIHQSVKSFDVTLCGTMNEDKIKTSFKRPKFETFRIDKTDFSKKSKGYKLVAKDVEIEEEKSVLENKILWFFHQEPVVIRMDTNNKTSVCTLIRLLAGKLKFVLFGQEIDKNEFAQLEIFQHISDLKQKKQPLFEGIINLLEISLQGRSPIALQILTSRLGDISTFLTVRDLLECNTLKIGEKKEELPDYVSRDVEKVTLLTASLSRIVRDSFIISCNGNKDFMEKIRTFLKTRPPTALRKKLYEEGEIVDSNQISENAMLLLKDCNTDQFFNIVKDVKKGNIHFLRAVDDKNLEWITTKGSIERLNQGEFSKIRLPESEIHDRFKEPVNIICARPGMGKSTIMKSIKNKTPSDFWTVKINLIEHNQFFKTIPNLDEMVVHFLEFSKKSLLEKNLIEKFLNSKKIMWFFDGIDEMQKESITNAINCVEMLVSKEHKIWISSRYNFQKLLEYSFNVLAIDIEELGEDSQREYITKRLKHHYEEGQIEEIVEKLHQNARIKDNSHILGIPLQLYMLTEILIISKKNLENDIFTLTRMYHYYFKAKFKHYRQKAGFTTNIEKDFPINLGMYQLWALKSCLDSELYKSLKMSPPKHIDPQGIIIKFNEDGTAVFDHNTHVDYLVAIWLSKNFQKVPETKRTFIFEDKFENLRFLFDMVLAEEHPVILATLNKDIGALKQIEMEHLEAKDKFGRSALHICCSYGTKYPRVELEDCFEVKNVKRSEDLYPLHVDPRHREVLEYLLSQKLFDPLETDSLLQLNAFQYADMAKSIFSLAKISEERQYDLKNLEFYNHILTVLFYSVFKKFPSLLRMITNDQEFKNIVNTKIRTVAEEGTFLHIATKGGHLEIVELLLKNGADINIIDGEQRTPVIIAAGERHFHILKFFSKYISLPVAAFLGSLDLIKGLLKAGEYIDKEDPCYGGGTAFFAATYAANLPILKYLVEAKANFNWKNRHGYNALHVASEKGDLEIVQYLVDLGIKLNIVTEFGNTALQLAVKQNRIEVVRYLLTKNADIKTIDILGQTTMDLCTTRKMKILLEEEMSRNSSTSLHWNAHHGDEDVIRNHLRTFTDGINSLDGLGRTALHMAAKNGQERVVNLLIESGATVNLSDDLGDSPLHAAVERGHLKVVKLLLDAGADVKQINKTGRTPIQMTHKPEILEELLTTRTKEIVFNNLGHFHRAAALRNLDKIKSSIEELAADVDFNGQTVLHWAAREGHSDIVKFLIEAKIDPTLRNGSGHTALYLAIRHGHSSCIQYLIDATQNTEEGFENDNTILHIATMNNSIDAVEELLKLGAVVDSSNANGKTSLHIAVELKHKRIIDILIAKGANVEAIDADGLKPIYFAYGNEELIGLLGCH